MQQKCFYIKFISRTKNCSIYYLTVNISTDRATVRYDKTNELAGVVVDGGGGGEEKGLITRKRIKNTLLYLSPR